MCAHKFPYRHIHTHTHTHESWLPWVRAGTSAGISEQERQGEARRGADRPVCASFRMKKGSVSTRQGRLQRGVQSSMAAVLPRTPEEEDDVAESAEHRARERGEEDEDDVTQSADHRARERGEGGRCSTERGAQSEREGRRRRTTLQRVRSAERERGEEDAAQSKEHRARSTSKGSLRKDQGRAVAGAEATGEARGRHARTWHLGACGEREKVSRGFLFAPEIPAQKKGAWPGAESRHEHTKTVGRPHILLLGGTILP